MKLSVEISMYPLQDEYMPKISDYLDYLNHDIKVRELNIETRSSNMSTRVFGEFDEVHALLGRAMRRSMEKHGKIVFVCKFLEGDARSLEGYD